MVRRTRERVQSMGWEGGAVEQHAFDWHFERGSAVMLLLTGDTGFIGKAIAMEGRS